MNAGHPYFQVVDNRADFSSKITRVLSSINKFIGLKGTKWLFF
jgi:hypothetical protein